MRWSASFFAPAPTLWDSASAQGGRGASGARSGSSATLLQGNRAGLILPAKSPTFHTMAAHMRNWGCVFLPFFAAVAVFLAPLQGKNGHLRALGICNNKNTKVGGRLPAHETAGALRWSGGGHPGAAGTGAPLSGRVDLAPALRSRPGACAPRGRAPAAAFLLRPPVVLPMPRRGVR